MINFDQIKKDFPILNRKVNGKPLVYLDNGATTQKPEAVIEAVADYYRSSNANVHRGAHTLGDESTRAYEEAREAVAGFLGATSNELVFVRNTTEALNLVRYGWANQVLGEGDLILVSELEHHSNLITWQQVARDTGAQLTYVEVTHDGQVDVDHLEAILETLGDQVKLVALTHLSNTTGALLDLERVTRLRDGLAKEAKLVVDAAQSAPRVKIGFDDSGVDFMAFSGHKLYGPMGIGGLLIKKDLLDEIQPMLVGGGMISEVYLNGYETADLPDRFDAGTPNVAGAVGLAAAVQYLEKLGMGKVYEHEKELTLYGLEKLGKLESVEIIGPNYRNTKHETRNTTEIESVNRLGSVAFVHKRAHAHDVAQILDSEGVAVRSGHHCTMPFHNKMKLAASVRASFGVYNNKADVESLVAALGKVDEVFGVESQKLDIKSQS